MKFNVENGWRGSLDGIARSAALAPRGDLAVILIPRADLIGKQPRDGQTITANGNRYVIEAVALEDTNLKLRCRIVRDDR